MRSRKTLADALRQLERSAGRLLDHDAARQLRDEVATHFEAAVQARIEMGDSREEAERRTVDEFGDIRRVVQRVSEAQAPPRRAIDPLFTAALIAGGIFYCGAYLTPFGTGALITLGGILASCAVGAWASWRVRRLQWRSFLIALVPAWLCLTASLSIVYRTPAPGESMMRPTEVAEGIAFRKKSIVVQSNYLANLEAAHGKFLREGGLQVPRDFDRETGEIVFGTARNAEFARRSWELVRESFPRQHASIARESSWITSAEAALDRSWINGLPYQALSGLAMAAAINALLFVPHLIALFSRWLSDEVRRTIRRRRRA